MKKVLFILFLFLSISLTAQNYKVVKIIDADKYQLENGVIVSLAEVFIPNLDASDQKYNQLSKEIIDWAKNTLLDRSFKTEFLAKDKDSVIISYMYISYAFSDEDLGKRMISNGYAINQSSSKSPKYQEYVEAEQRARKQKVGIWKILNEDEIAALPTKTGTTSNFRIPDVSEVKTYSYTTKPYLSLLPLGIASFIISWDSFKESGIDGLSDDIKTRKIAVGITALVAGVFTTIFALKSVEVTYDQNNLNLRIKL